MKFIIGINVHFKMSREWSPNHVFPILRYLSNYSSTPIPYRTSSTRVKLFRCLIGLLSILLSIWCSREFRFVLYGSERCLSTLTFTNWYARSIRMSLVKKINNMMIYRSFCGPIRTIPMICLYRACRIRFSKDIIPNCLLQCNVRICSI